MSAPQWKGLFEWTMQHADGTNVSDIGQTTVNPEKMAWLQNVLQNYVKDLVVRMKEIKDALEEPENVDSGLKQQEVLLDELKDIVEDVYQAKNLHVIGGVPLLTELLQSPQQSLRWRAAEIVATCVQNDEENQKAFFEDGMLPLVQRLTHDEDDMCRLKGWMAVSCLIRNFQPATDAFLKTGGLGELLKTLYAKDIRLIRRGLLLLQYTLCLGLTYHAKELKDVESVSRLSAFLEHEDVDVREQSLAVLSAMMKSQEYHLLLTEDDRLKDRVSAMEKELHLLTDAEKQDRSPEIELVKELMAALNA